MKLMSIKGGWRRNGLIIALMMGSIALGCGGSGGGVELSISTPFTTLYLRSLQREFIDYLSTESEDDCSQSSFRSGYDIEYKAVLNGDIEGTTVGMHLWLSALNGTEIEASIVLAQGGGESVLATWPGLTTSDEDEHELFSETAAIDEQQTSAGDQIILRLACSGADDFCRVKYGCIDSYIAIPDIGANGVGLPEE